MGILRPSDFVDQSPDGNFPNSGCRHSAPSGPILNPAGKLSLQSVTSLSVCLTPNDGGSLWLVTRGRGFPRVFTHCRQRSDDHEEKKTQPRVGGIPLVSFGVFLRYGWEIACGFPWHLQTRFDSWNVDRDFCRNPNPQPGGSGISFSSPHRHPTRAFKRRKIPARVFPPTPNRNPDKPRRAQPESNVT